MNLLGVIAFAAFSIAIIGISRSTARFDRYGREVIGALGIFLLIASLIRLAVVMGLSERMAMSLSGVNFIGAVGMVCLIAIARRMERHPH